MSRCGGSKLEKNESMIRSGLLKLNCLKGSDPVDSWVSVCG